MATRFPRPPPVRRWSAARLVTRMGDVEASARIVVWLAVLALLGVLGLFIYQFLDPALSRSRANRRCCHNNSKVIDALQAQVDVLDALVFNIIHNPPALFERAEDATADFNITTGVVQIVNDGSGSATTSGIGLVYNTTTSCVGGPGIQVNDTVIIKLEATGVPPFILTMRTQIFFCNGSLIPFQGSHAEFTLLAGTEQTYTTDFSFTYTQDMVDAGGVAIYGTASETYLIEFTNFLIFRYRPLTNIVL